MKIRQNITIDEHLWQKLVNEAHKQNRKNSNMIETIIRDYFDKKGDKK